MFRRRSGTRAGGSASGQGRAPRAPALAVAESR